MLCPEGQALGDSLLALAATGGDDAAVAPGPASATGTHDSFTATAPGGHCGAPAQAPRSLDHDCPGQQQ
jgi:hypothetical protein